MAAFYAADIIRNGRIQRKKQELLQQDYIIYQEFQNLPELQGLSKLSESSNIVETEIAEHDVLILKRQLQEQFDMNCALQDYIAKWCHEVKIPLSASLLMAEKIEDAALKESFLEQLERMNMLLRSALLGTKMQSSLFDLQVQETSLLKCVKESIHNNQFFLVRKHFTLDIQIGTSSNVGKDTTGGTDTIRDTDSTGDIDREDIDREDIDREDIDREDISREDINREDINREDINREDMNREDIDNKDISEKENIRVYTDPLWLTYVLDQLISNSIKYAKENPILRIYSQKQGDTIQLCVEDNGEGIKESDIRRIFEKGYIGSNYHNGQYKSTGMGLYMVSEILKKLEHEIAVESEYGKGTKFTITFQDNREYFHL